MNDVRESRAPIAPEWPTWATLAGCYAAWGLSTWYAAVLPPWVFLPVTILSVTLHWSLQHEALHGHPTRNRAVNEALVFPPLGLLIVYRMFRESHLRHHTDDLLTDPRLDPESWYLTRERFAALPAPVRAVLRLNNTLAGRMLVGPAVIVARSIVEDGRRLLAGDRDVALAYLLHGAGAALVLGWVVGVCGIDAWLYLLGVAYPALSLLTIRTYAEHQAAAEVGPRTAIIEASPFFGFLFLNNNLHVVHHAHPGVPWYALPALYRAGRRAYRLRNGGYGFDGYGEMFRRHLFRAKEPVAHPLD